MAYLSAPISPAPQGKLDLWLFGAIQREALMSVVRCPRCRDEVTVPSGATSRALVRCPLCMEEYLVAEALANSPPALVIIGGEVAQEALQLPVESSEYQLAGGPADVGNQPQA